jgi:hypothetical protein
MARRRQRHGTYDRAVTNAAAVTPRTVLLRIALLGLAIRVALEALGLASAAAHHQPVLAHWLGMYWQWDAHPYLRIAQAGYRAVSRPGGSPFDKYYLGFFPGFPFAVKIAAVVVRSRVAAGLLVSYAASVLGAWFLYLLVLKDADHADAWRTVVLLLSFPTAYFFAAPYSEGLFFFAVTGSMYAARTERWPRAGASAALATFTRLHGLSLLPGLAAEALFGRRQRMRRLAWTAAGALGLLAFMAISERVAHDPFRYFVLQRTHWQQTTVWPWTTVAEAAGSLWRGTTPILTFVFVNRLAAIAFAAPLLVLAVRRLRVADSVYGWAGFVPLLCTGWLTALPRFLLVLYPLFMVMTQLTRSRRVLLPVVFIGAALQAYFFWRFAAGEWTF